MVRRFFAGGLLLGTARRLRRCTCAALPWAHDRGEYSCGHPHRPVRWGTSRRTMRALPHAPRWLRTGVQR